MLHFLFISMLHLSSDQKFYALYRAFILSLFSRLGSWDEWLSEKRAAGLMEQRALGVVIALVVFADREGDMFIVTRGHIKQPTLRF